VIAIGWIGVGPTLGSIRIPPAAAYISRGVSLGVLGFATAYSRMPTSLEQAARLVNISPIRRARIVVAPLLTPSLAATSALIAALIFADRDVSSLLLAPGSSRVTLSLYLLSANAPIRVIGVAALAVFFLGFIVISVAAAIPLVLLIPRD
jgi:ABC-type Fe3+ transport system permease subunit